MSKERKNNELDVKNPKDEELNNQLRPLGFDEFTGQNKLVSNLQIFIEASKMRGETLDHVLLTGPPGLGKTTLSYIIAHELGRNIKTTSGPVLEKAGDLAGLLTNLDEGDVLFIDEIHRIPIVVEEFLYSAMEDFRIDIMIDSGPAARTIKLEIPRFSLIGATTRAGLLSAPLRTRFGIVSRLDYYPTEDLIKVVKRSANIIGIQIENQGAYELASRSRGTPRIANKLLRRARDFAQVMGDGIITWEIAKQTLEALDVDECGLDEMDKRILKTIIEKYKGGPVGLNTLSIAVSEESGTIEEVYEPFLIQQGFLQITSRGRIVTDSAYKYFGIRRNKEIDLFDL
jgi:Holliday junction DNA helicase RuvB